MARYERTFTGERRTEKVTLQLTPTERAELEDASQGQGAPNLSTYARELLFRRSAAVVAATRRNPEAKAIMEALDAAAYELAAIGNNLNQIARALNTTGDLRDWQKDELREAIRLFEKGETQHIAAVERVLAL
jgi:hypothetical protein